MITFNADQIVSVVQHDAHINTEWTYHPPKKKLFGGIADEYWTNFFYSFSGEKYTKDEVNKKEELVMIDNIVYNKAKVFIQFSGDQSIRKKYYFDSDKESKDFYTKISLMIPNRF